MSIHEIYKEDIERVEKAAESTAAELYDNLRSYERGEREEFIAIFPVNIAGKDEDGRPNGVNDLAHNKFLEMLPIDDSEDIHDDYLVLSSGVKLFYREYVYEVNGQLEPYQMTYYSHPIPLDGIDI